MTDDQNTRASKRISYRELPEDKKEEIRRKQRERYAKQKALKNYQIDTTNSSYLNRNNLPLCTDDHVASTSTQHSYYHADNINNDRQHGDDQNNRASKRISYRELPEEEKEEIRRKQQERYAKQKVLKNYQIDTTNSSYLNRNNLPPCTDDHAASTSTQHSCYHADNINNVRQDRHGDRVSKRQCNHHTNLSSTDKRSSYQVLDSSNGCSGKNSLYQNSSSKNNGRFDQIHSVELENSISHTIMSTTSRSQSQNRVTRFRDLLQNVPSEAFSLPSVPICIHCKAERFIHETNGFCCADGKIYLATNEVPNELFALLTSTTSDSAHFRTYIRTYNNQFAFTSLGVKYDHNLCQRNNEIYTFRAQGQIYHNITDLLPSDGRPSNLQLYFYDTEHELDNRLLDSQYRMLPTVTSQLIHILRINLYSIFFRSLGDMPDLERQIIHVRSDAGLDQRVFNAPTSSQVAAIWVENNNENQIGRRDIFVYNHSGRQFKVQYYYGCYDSLQYPLLFPYGDNGWHKGIEKVGETQSRSVEQTQTTNPRRSSNVEELLAAEEAVSIQETKEPKVSCREYYCFKFQIREDERSILLLSGRLLQQYAVDMYVKMETSRLDYYRGQQMHIRTELYQGIVDTITLGERDASNVVKRIILPSSFIGGPRDMRKRYMEAMALVQCYGKPDIFLTMTCNPNWKEITNELCQHEESHNRPDLVARVFHAKLEELKDRLFKKEIFGKVAAYVYVIEHQKRGLPHAHFLIILKRDWKVHAPESFDEIVSAEIPDKNSNIHLHKAVVKHMMHGPCGDLNKTNVCMKGENPRCKNNFPKKYAPFTSVGNDCFPIYRRSNNGVTVKVRGATLDNRWVVPFNPYLLATFDCHINVEICSTVKAVKYLYKYIYKGHDRVAFNLVSKTNNQQVDEIHQFQTARWIAAPEAMWRIYGFIVNEMSPAVYSLHLHLKNQHTVTFRGNSDLSNIANSEHYKKSMLTEFFELNKVDENARMLLYRQIPEYYVWNNQNRRWTPRKKKDSNRTYCNSKPIRRRKIFFADTAKSHKRPVIFRRYQDSTWHIGANIS
ncbi:uncharacterized protein LOC115695347 isoform X2 [Cannabis sativa]|uniref:uncharacterized protein LOC115695347 isoform X2 n=1 Tax=Cannabis sativa TaxID=3483 RepID=UPI0029CAA761|nr:uncharacterized protein LOC115695347 isoform X2 [Cannabis sativa]XP_060973323.1 uncharacterized protein LOC115695347 isoform X2 [Cannabis sativa]